MMLDANTLEWLERRKITCNRCGVKRCALSCRGKVYGDCYWFEVKSQGTKTGRLKEDFSDAAEFEKRVAEKLKDHAWLCFVEGAYDGLYFPCRKVPDYYVLRAARLAVEAEMIAEGKGPGWRDKV